MWLGVLGRKGDALWVVGEGEAAIMYKQGMAGGVVSDTKYPMR